MGLLHHYSDREGYNSIRASVSWRFEAHMPRGAVHPRGAYFTMLAPDVPNLANRLRIPKSKTAYFFTFVDVGDLMPLRGGRGRYIFYSAGDVVETTRQVSCGCREL
jgi:hypothetical protein